MSSSKKVTPNLAALVDAITQTCAAGLPLRYLRTCAEVTDEGRLHISAQEQKMRQGPYPYFVRGGEQVGIDDYAFTGKALLVGAKGSVMTRNKKLVVVEANEAFSVSDYFHIVRPDEHDYAYVHAVLTALDARRYLQGTSAAPMLELAALRTAIIPWPDKQTRDMFAQAMSICKQEHAPELAETIAHTWLQTTHDMTRLEHAPVIERNAYDEFSQSVKENEREDRNAIDPQQDTAEDGVILLLDKLLDVLSPTEDDLLDVVATTTNLESEALPGQATTCICFPPPNQGVWTSKAVNINDPRWVFGAPPRNKANYAWIQQTIACMHPKSCAVLLLGNAALHTTIGREYATRCAWAQSGTIEAVIALPGGIFADDRPPSSLVIMRKHETPSTKKDILFINALEKGCDIRRSASSSIVRHLPTSSVESIVNTYVSWLQKTGYRDRAGYCRSASPHLIEQNDYQLTPWTYTG